MSHQRNKIVAIAQHDKGELIATNASSIRSLTAPPPNSLFSRTRSAKSAASAYVFATKTPLPAHQPSTFSTRGCGSVWSFAIASAAEANVPKDCAVGIPCRFRNSFANILLPSRRAHSLEGPTILEPGAEIHRKSRPPAAAPARQPSDPLRASPRGPLDLDIPKISAKDSPAAISHRFRACTISLILKRFERASRPARARDRRYL